MDCFDFSILSQLLNNQFYGTTIYAIRLHGSAHFDEHVVRRHAID